MAGEGGGWEKKEKREEGEKRAPSTTKCEMKQKRLECFNILLLLGLLKGVAPVFEHEHTATLLTKLFVVALDQRRGEVCPGKNGGSCSGASSCHVDQEPRSVPEAVFFLLTRQE